MKLNRLLVKAAFVAVLVLNIGTASAADVDYSGSSIDMGSVSVGQTGTVNASGTGSLYINDISGSLPSNSMITFSYNFTGNLLSGVLASGGEYSYNLEGNNYYGNSLSIKPSGPVSNYATVNGVASPSLVLASSQIDFQNNTATTVITNNSAGVASFTSLFAGLVIGEGRGLDVAYSVSAVPLPAALPLFGAGLGALAGFNFLRRRKEAA